MSLLNHKKNEKEKTNEKKKLEELNKKQPGRMLDDEQLDMICGGMMNKQAIT